MIYTQIGTTGISVPPIIFGTSALGNLYASHDYDTKQQIVQECFRTIPGRPVVFDSAGKYGAGMALEMLGKCLENLNINADDVLISNKLGWLQTTLNSPEPTFEKGVWHDLTHDAVQHIGYQGILRCWEQGNALLGEQFKPGLLSVHDPDEYIDSASGKGERNKRYDQVLEAYRALSELKARGYVKALGVGAKNWKIIRELAGDVDFDWIMIANSLTLLTHPAELLDFISSMHQKGVTIINSAVFNSGFLVGSNYLDYQLLDPKDAAYAKYFRWRDKFFKLCQRYQVRPSHVCIQFGLSPPGVVAVALNTSKPGNVEKNVFEVTSSIPPELFSDMKKESLIDKDYPWI